MFLGDADQNVGLREYAIFYFLVAGSIRVLV